VVVDIGGQDIGVVVDAVTEVLRIAADSVEPPSAVITTADSVYLLGIVKLEGRLVILLDLEKVLTESEKNALTEAAAIAAD
jgi:purine-binding chemotaxis protein CheW